MSARGRIPQRVYPGGHIGPPLRGGGGVPNQRKIGAKTGPCLRGGTEPAPYRGSGAGRCVRRRGAPGVWLPPAKFRNGIWGVSHRHRPLRGEGKVSATARASGAQRSVYASGRKGWAGIGAGITPKGAINLGQSLSQPAADSSLYTREPWDGDADCRVGPAGLLAMTTAFCHSEAGAHTGRGNPSFYDGRGCGPPRSSAPTEGLPTSQQRADVPKAWPPPTKFRAEIWGVSHRHRPLRVVAESCRDLPGSA